MNDPAKDVRLFIQRSVNAHISALIDIKEHSSSSLSFSGYCWTSSSITCLIRAGHLVRCSRISFWAIYLNRPLHFHCSYSAAWKQGCMSNMFLCLAGIQKITVMCLNLCYTKLCFHLHSHTLLFHCIFPYFDHLPGSMVSFHRLKSCADGKRRA